MNERVHITGDGACIEANCPMTIDERGIHIPQDVLNTILQEEPERRADWTNAKLILANMDE